MNDSPGDCQNCDRLSAESESLSPPKVKDTYKKWVSFNFGAYQLKMLDFIKIFLDM